MTEQEFNKLKVGMMFCRYMSCGGGNSCPVGFDIVRVGYDMKIKKRFVIAFNRMNETYRKYTYHKGILTLKEAEEFHKCNLKRQQERQQMFKNLSKN